jgi:hypothetical protein
VGCPAHAERSRSLKMSVVHALTLPALRSSVNQGSPACRWLASGDLREVR